MLRLLKEIKNKGIEINLISKELGIQRETLSRKLHLKQPFLLQEVIIIHKKFFNEFRFEDLFEDFYKGEICFMNKEDFVQLEMICEPIVEYLQKNHNQNCTVIISDSQIRIVEDKLSIPIKNECDQT